MLSEREHRLNKTGVVAQPPGREHALGHVEKHFLASHGAAFGDALLALTAQSQHLGILIS